MNRCDRCKWWDLMRGPDGEHPCLHSAHLFLDPENGDTVYLRPIFGCFYFESKESEK